MENFNWISFTKKIAIKAKLSDLYDAWTVPSKIEGWFLSKANFQSESGDQLEQDLNVTKGSSYEWFWYLYDGVGKGKITKTNGVDFLQFTFAGDCLVDVQLTQVNENVVVQLTQSNIPIDNESKRGIRLGCDSGWSFFLVNLKSVYEGGLDLRNKDPQLKGMLNS
ncbi:MAG: SRPBCC domain-containing protein [Flavobacteriales bacterium]|nr:SRPBCC domain-containing protein [Flavobacteriales bacterium]